MGRRLKREEVMTIGVLADRGMSRRGIARQLGLAESSVRYRLRRRAEGARDGRARQAFAAAARAGDESARTRIGIPSRSPHRGRQAKRMFPHF